MSGEAVFTGLLLLLVATGSVVLGAFFLVPMYAAGWSLLIGAW